MEKSCYITDLEIGFFFLCTSLSEIDSISRKTPGDEMCHTRHIFPDSYFVGVAAVSNPIFRNISLKNPAEAGFLIDIGSPNRILFSPASQARNTLGRKPNSIGFLSRFFEARGLTFESISLSRNKQLKTPPLRMTFSLLLAPSC